MDLSVLYKSFYSKDFYRNEAVAGKGVRFTLLALVAILSILVIFIQGRGTFEKFFAEVLPPVIEQMPTVTIEKGNISIDKSLPHYVYFGGKKQEEAKGLAVVFTDERLTDIDAIKSWMVENNAPIVVTPTDIMVYMTRKGELRVLEAENFEVFSPLTPEKMQNFAANAKIWFWPAVFIAGIPLLWLGRIIQALLFSVLGLVINAVVRAKLTYFVLLRFSSLAIWPAFVITMVAALAGFPLSGFISIGLVAAFLIFGIISARKTAA